jgi:hypothetical protein
VKSNWLELREAPVLAEGDPQIDWSWHGRVQHDHEPGAARAAPARRRPAKDDAGALHEVEALLATGKVRNQNQAFNKIAGAKYPYARDHRLRRSYAERLRRKYVQQKKSST